MASHRSNRKRDALLDNTIPLLDFAGDALDLLPVLGLSAVAKGLSLIVTRVRDARANDDSRRSFMAEAKLLESTLMNMVITTEGAVSALDNDEGHRKQVVLNGIAQSQDLRLRVETLLSVIQDLRERSKDLKGGKGASGFLKGVVYSSGNASLLSEMKESLASAARNFQMEGQISIEKILAAAIQIAKDMEEQKVLDDLPRTDAGYRCVDELKSEFHPGTRQEMFGELTQWLEDPDQLPVYFLSGGAGLGKSSITHQLCARLDNSTEGCSLGASFFFVRGSGDLESARLFFSSLAHQLAQSQPSLRPYITSAAREYLKRRSRQQMKHTFEDLFRRPFQRAVLTFPKPVALVIDGLDECRDRDLIPNLLESLLELPSVLPGIRVFLTSRPEPYIQSVLTSASALPSISHRSLNETVAQWEGDVRLYLEQMVPKISPYGDFVHHNPDQLERLIKRAAGVFNFARVAVRFLDAYHDHPEEQFALLLSDEGTGLSALDALYLQILSLAFPPEGWSTPLRAARLRSFLIFIGLSREPLSPDAMALLRLETEISKADIISMTDRLRSVLLIDSQGRIVALHATFNEFLLDPQRCVNSLYHVDRTAGNGLLASACLGTFTFPMMSDYLVADEDTPIREYINYSQKHWDVHLKEAEFSSSLKAVLIHFLETQIPAYMRLHARSWSEGLFKHFEGWFPRSAENGTQIVVALAKAQVYHGLMWAVFNSRGRFPHLSAEHTANWLRRKVHPEFAVRCGVDLTVSDADLARFRSAHNRLMEQIRAGGPAMQALWLDPWAPYMVGDRHALWLDRALCTSNF
ncbi:hypothetical protein FB45DRAFT_340601 [Roridomyces roridus]|uniref:NACHT domain-containing protein n=1 Tax=Roridomyces roridus TaxID=1738132 RepID=A0AAD7B3X4_9AGAR|nr:hypothetical protein FB45DRAFT_340601 [Roridomyces roridus]